MNKEYSHNRLPILLTAVSIGLAALCFTFPASAKPSVLRLPVQQLSAQELPAIRSDSGIAGRSLINMPTGPFVVLHYPPIVAPKSDGDGFRQPTNEEIDKLNDSMRLLAFPDATTFNCVTFALADTLGLTAYDWVEPFPKDATYFTDPTQIALDSYFDLILETDIAALNWTTLENGLSLEEGDVVRFSKKSGSALVTLHMGRVYRANQENRMLSKLGVGPVVSSRLRFGADSFQCDHISIYRGKSKPKA